MQPPPANKWAHAESVEKALGMFGLGPDHGLRTAAVNDVYDMCCHLGLKYQKIKYDEDAKPVRKNFHVSFAATLAAIPFERASAKMFESIEWKDANKSPFRR